MSNPGLLGPLVQKIFLCCNVLCSITVLSYSDFFSFHRQNWCDIYSSKYDDSSLVPMATNMAKCLINKALLHNQQGKIKIQNVS